MSTVEANKEQSVSMYVTKPGILPAGLKCSMKLAGVNRKSMRFAEMGLNRDVTVSSVSSIFSTIYGPELPFQPLAESCAAPGERLFSATLLFLFAAGLICGGGTGRMICYVWTGRVSAERGNYYSA